MRLDVGAVPFIDACTMSSAIVTHCAGRASPGRHPLSTTALRSAVSRPGGSSGRLISMAIASWPIRRVACVAGTGSKPATAGLQPRKLAAARRRAWQRADRASWLPDPLGQRRVLARSGGHGQGRFGAPPTVATTCPRSVRSQAGLTLAPLLGACQGPRRDFRGRLDCPAIADAYEEVEPLGGFAALAVQHAAVASDPAATFLPGLAPSAVEGFAVGTLLSGLCFPTVVALRRRSRRKSQAAGNAVRAAATRQSVGAARAIPDPFADEAAEVLLHSYLPGEASFEVLTIENDGHNSHPLTAADPEPGHSRHPLTAAGPEPRPAIRRGAGRHAAPPPGVGGRMIGKRVFR
jgi:hypothetical protein